MKINSWKKVVAFLAVVALVLSFVGCGNGTTSTDNATTSSGNGTTSTDNGATTDDSKSGSASGAEPLGKYDPAIDISFVRTVDDDLSSNVLPNTPGETMEDNRWLKLYKDELGINISYDWTVNGGYNDDAYKQKINVTLSTGDLPDVIPVTASQLKQLADADAIEDMTKYWDEYAAPLTKDVYTQEGPGVLSSATIDGKLMAIPNADASIECAHFMWIRTDWLKNLNLEVPKNMDELLKVAEAFTTQDPDKNGKDDTYGLVMTKDLYSGCMGLEGFFAGYHAYPNFWNEVDGKLAYGSIQPEVKTALAKLADMYAKGQIDKEFGVKDGGKAAETIAAGKVGIDFGEQWNPIYPLLSNYTNDNSADWTGYSLISCDDTPVKIPLRFRTSLHFAVRKGYEHPEALVKLINMHLEKNWGETNNFEYYYMPAENNNVSVWKFSPVTPFPPYKNLNVFLDIEAARNSNSLDKLVGEAKVVEGNVESFANGNGANWGWEKIYGVNGVYNHLKKNRADNALLVEKFVGAPTPTMVERKATLEKLEKEEFVKIIMGQSPVSDFDKFVENWKKLGGDDITKEVNEWYSSTK